MPLAFSATDITAHLNLANASTIVAAGDAAFFVGLESPGERSSPTHLWRTDGTLEGTSRLAQIGDSTELGGSGHAVGDEFFYFGPTTTGFSSTLWVSDGTSNGTRRFGLTTEDGIQDIIVADNIVYYVIANSRAGADPAVLLHATDGTAIGPQYIDRLEYARSHLGQWGFSLFEFNGKLMYTVNGESPIFATDGTPTGTVNLGRCRGSIVTGFAICPQAKTDSYFFFIPVNDSGRGNELWVSDGTQSGTRLLLTADRVGSMYSGGQLLFFSAFVNGEANLWRTDGTVTGTFSLGQNIDGNQYTPLRDRLLFSRYSDGLGNELWTTDGTAEGTSIVKDIRPAAMSGSPRSLTVAGDSLYFLADSPRVGVELWVSDGTESGTRLVKDIAPGPVSSDIGWIQAFNNRVYFQATDGVSTKIWVSDGTDAGTTWLASQQHPDGFSNLGGWYPELKPNELWFRAYTEQYGTELYRTDGTVEGTSIVVDIRPGPASADPENVTSVDGNVLLYVGRHLYGITELPPQAPASVTASDGSIADRVRVTWSASSRAQSYEVWRGTSSDRSRATKIADGITATTFHDTTAALRRTHYYWIRASNASGTGDFSAPDTGSRSGQTILVDSGQRLGNYKTNDLLLGDLDADGDLDIFQSNTSGQGNRVWFNDGFGGMEDSGQTLGVANSIYGELGDVDRDGDLDAMIAAEDHTSIWLNDGAGRFSDSGQRLTGQFPIDVALGDLDRDGDLDAYIASAQSSTVRYDTIWINDGNGIFVDSGQRLGGSDSRRVELADLDRDGDLDAFVANRGTDRQNRVWINDGAARFTDSGLRLGNSHTQALAVGDLDGDGDVDLVEANIVAGETSRVLRNDGNNTFSDTGQMLGGSGYAHVSLGDADGDGDLDAFLNSDLYLNNGTGQFILMQTVGSNSGQQAFLADFDGDRDLDVIAGYFDQPSRLFRNVTQPPQVLAIDRNDGNQRFHTLTSITFTFSDDVSSTVTNADLTLYNVRTNHNVNVSSAETTTIAGSNRVRFDLGGIQLDSGLYFIYLVGTGVSNILGRTLDGNGDGVGGDDFYTTLRVERPGDINRDDSIDVNDIELLFRNWGGPGLRWDSGDHNFDGIVDAADAGLLFAHWTGNGPPAYPLVRKISWRTQRRQAS